VEWVVLAELLVAIPIFLFGLVEIHLVVGTLAFLLMIPASILLTAFICGWRNNDPVEVIAISPKMVYIKPPNGWIVRVARHELREIKIRKPWRDSMGYTFGWAIILSFDKHNWQMVCEGRSEEDTQAIASALQKAMTATSVH
jgi:hypothetical protein